MWQRIRRILIIVLAAAFVFCAVSVGLIQLEYRSNRKVYQAASESFTSTAAPAAAPEETEEPEEEPGETAPKKVDFQELLAVNPDIVGWIYCEDTVIDYPVAQCADNDTYLTTGYDKAYNGAGFCRQPPYQYRHPPW